MCSEEALCSRSLKLLLPLLLLLLLFASVAPGEGTGEEDAAGGSVQTGVIAGFGVDSALVPVGADVQLRCRVTRIDGGSFVQLTKSIPDTDRQEVLTTNVVKEHVIDGIERYSIAAEQYGDHGYDFIFTITDARVEDSGSYSCSVPMVDETEHVDLFVVSEPTSLELYVDVLRVDALNNSLIEYDNVTDVDIRCVAAGGHPQPIVAVTTGTDDAAPTSVDALCRPQPSDLPAFLPNLTCSTTVYVQRFRVDHTTSRKRVTCTARSRGSADVRLSASFTPYLVGDPPAMNCKRSVTAAVDKSDVRLVCRVTSEHPLIDARITWNGQQHLRPTDRPGWPPGVRFDSDGEYRAYLRQRGNEIVLELELERVSAHTFRDYTFVVTNSVGVSRQTVTLVRDPMQEALHKNGARSFRDVTTYFAHVITLATMSLYQRR